MATKNVLQKLCAAFTRQGREEKRFPVPEWKQKRQARLRELRDDAVLVAVVTAIELFGMYLVFFAPDPAAFSTRPPEAMRVAISSDHLIPADQYEDYYRERNAYLAGIREGRF